MNQYSTELPRLISAQAVARRLAISVYRAKKLPLRYIQLDRQIFFFESDLFDYLGISMPEASRHAQLAGDEPTLATCQ